MNAKIKANFPEMPPMVGFASTASFRSVRLLGSGDAYGTMEKQVEGFAELPGPAVVAFQDLDDRGRRDLRRGTCSTYKGFGSGGFITSGGGRELLEVKGTRLPGLHRLDDRSHACCHILHIAPPVRVGGLVVNPGDLLHGDANGVTNIPIAIAADVADISQEFVDAKIVLDVRQRIGNRCPPASTLHARNIRRSSPSSPRGSRKKRREIMIAAELLPAKSPEPHRRWLAGVVYT